MPIIKDARACAVGRTSFIEMSDVQQACLVTLELAVCGLGGSRAGVLGLRALLGSCRALWEGREELEWEAMGCQPWARGLRGGALRAAARQRFFWASVPPFRCSVGVGDTWHNAYAFAVGANGYAVLGRAPSLHAPRALATLPRPVDVNVWYTDAAGTVGCVVHGCDQGCALVLGPVDPCGGRVGQWSVASFVRFNGALGLVVLNGALVCVYEICYEASGGPFAVCTGASERGGYFCCYNRTACLVVTVNADGTTTDGRPHRVAVQRVRVQGRPVRALGAVMFRGVLYVIEGGAVHAAALPAAECTTVCRGRGLTGAVCALEPTPGCHGLALISQTEGVLWWREGSARLQPLHPVAWVAGEDCSLAALDAQRFAIVERGGRIRVVCAATGAGEEDFHAVRKPPRQIAVLADVPSGRSCVAVLKADCSLMVWGARELCRLPI